LVPFAERNGLYYGAIPRLDAESLKTYVARYISNAYLDGKVHLLLQYTNTNDARKDEIAEAWDEALKEIG